MNVGKENFNRLAKAIMEQYDISYIDAVSRLESFHLQLICDESIRESVSLQTALLTAMNAGRRAYLGGVSVAMPANVKSMLPWPEKKTLDEILEEYENIHFCLPENLYSNTQGSVLYFGNTIKGQGGLRVLCDGWRGGVLPIEDHAEFTPKNDFSLGGVLAGGIAVSQSFLNISGLDSLAGHDTVGLSLWEPMLDWRVEESAGPPLKAIPEKLWIIGLGHLGQAYLWTLGLLKNMNDKPITILLQDFDYIEDSNWSSGLLCEKKDFGRRKTRVCSDWLEARGFKTTITERLFDKNTKRAHDDPYIALCGVDKAEPRSRLEGAGFDLVVESGLGGTISDFDRIIVHTFPNPDIPASQAWPVEENKPERVHNRIEELTKDQGDCGILARTLSNVAVSTAFVGTVAASLVIGELLKGLHGGKRTKVLHTKLRDLDNLEVVFFVEPYSTEMGKNGFIEVGETSVSI